MSNNYQLIYNLTYHKLNTLTNLLDHIRYDGYSEVLFKKASFGFLAYLSYEVDSIEVKFECEFDKDEYLQRIHVIENQEKKLIFDREYELSVEKALYILEQSSDLKLNRSMCAI